MITLKMKVGKNVLEVADQQGGWNGIKSICKVSAFVGALPQKCGLCGSDDIYLYHKSPKGNDYYGLACNACGAEFNFHQKKEGGFYIKADDKWTKYMPDNTSKPDDKFEDDIPFDEGGF